MSDHIKRILSLLTALASSFVCNLFCFFLLFIILFTIFKFVKHNIVIKPKLYKRLCSENWHCPHPFSSHLTSKCPLRSHPSRWVNHLISFWFLLLVAIFCTNDNMHIHFISPLFLDKQIACHTQYLALAIFIQPYILEIIQSFHRQSSFSSQLHKNPWRRWTKVYWCTHSPMYWHLGGF